MNKAHLVTYEEGYKNAKIEVFDTKTEAGAASFKSTAYGKLLLADVTDLSGLGGQELVALYNSINGADAIRKFRDLETGKTRVMALIKGLAESSAKGDTVGGLVTTKKYNKLNAEKKIHIIVDKNPRREHTAGHKSFALMTEGMTVSQYIAKGGRRVDLKWDIDRKNIELVD